MKILELRFKNLNSLYGEWFIDFTAPEYTGSGIFALTGPTGAGKSTILDAICLALYGSTPRLGKITKSTNEIMSRQTGECFAEVMFESQAGRFRCHWGQHRARKKPDGRLADARHEISDVETKKTIETKKSRVSTVIEEKTGMDFERFTRSILLAQGGFDTFLKADAEQKSRILEQITGTEIYSQISRRVHERQRNERDKLSLLQAETSGIVILEPEQEKEIQQELQTKQQQETALAAKSAETGRAIAWLTAIDGLKKEISTLAEEAAALQRTIEVFKPEREKLDRAVKAALLDGAYATLIAIRKQQSDDQVALKAEEAAFPGLKTAADTQAESLKSAEEQACKAKDELKAAAPLIQKIRSLDQKLAEQKKAVSEDNERCRKDAARIDADKQTRLKEQEKRAEAEKALEYSQRYLHEHEQDEWLISGLTGVEEQLGSLLFKQKEIAQEEANLKKADTALEKAIQKHNDSTKHSGIRKQECENAAKILRQGKEALSALLGDRLLREYRKEKETLLREMAYLKKIEELEGHRARLEDGKPCPLCGSKEHPFAEGNVPLPDETEQKIESLTRLINRAEDLEAANKKLEEAESTARNNLADSEKLEATSLGDKTAAEKSLVELQDDLDKLRAGFAELKQTVSVKLQPLGITEIPDGDISSLLASLKSRLVAWQDQVEKKWKIEKQIADIDSEMK
ncbi:MAG: AAA family ATPase, partial [Desulfocapsaceae bacterium]|nr:AAA family ATPase [Desulfocapsaceae bacterium]